MTIVALRSRVTRVSGVPFFKGVDHYPKDIESDGRAKRFLAVWDRVFETLPIKPKW